MATVPDPTRDLPGSAPSDAAFRAALEASRFEGWSEFEEDPGLAELDDHCLWLELMRKRYLDGDRAPAPY